VRLIKAQTKKQWFVVTGAAADLWAVQPAAAEIGTLSEDFATWSRTFDATRRMSAWLGTAPERCLTLRRKDLAPAAPTFEVVHGAIDVAATTRETRGRSVWVIQGRSAGSLVVHVPPGMDIDDVRIDQHSFPNVQIESGVLRLPLYLHSTRQRLVLAWRVDSTKLLLPRLEGASGFPVLGRLRAEGLAAPKLNASIRYGEYLVHALERRIDDLAFDWDRNRPSEEAAAPDAIRLQRIHAAYLQAKSALGAAGESAPLREELDAAWSRRRQVIAKYGRQTEADAIESDVSTWGAPDDPACLPQGGALGSATYFASDKPWSEIELERVGGGPPLDASSICRLSVYAAVILLSLFTARFRQSPWLWLGLAIGASAAWLTWGEPRWLSAPLLIAGAVVWRLLRLPHQGEISNAPAAASADGAKQ
jgi:hypothetical protein